MTKNFAIESFDDRGRRLVELADKKENGVEILNLMYDFTAGAKVGNKIKKLETDYPSSAGYIEHLREFETTPELWQLKFYWAISNILNILPDQKPKPSPGESSHRFSKKLSCTINWSLEYFKT